MGSDACASSESHSSQLNTMNANHNHSSGTNTKIGHTFLSNACGWFDWARIKPSGCCSVAAARHTDSVSTKHTLNAKPAVMASALPEHNEVRTTQTTSRCWRL